MTKNQIAIDAIIVAAKIIIVSNNVEQNMDGMDTKHGVEYKGWYSVFYGKETTVAFGIKYCPYCGELLEK